VGSAASWWLGFSPYLVASILLARGTHRLFAGYRRQGAALPVYDCGLLIGMAWLVAPPFVWFGIWAALAIAQLRKLKLGDLLKLLLGILTLPFIGAILAFVTDALPAFRQNLLEGIVGENLWAGFSESWPTITILALLSGACFGAFGRLTTRRPIQEQRANRMWYLMLGVAWIALLASGSRGIEALAILIYPVCVLLGIWLSELNRRIGNIILLLGLGAILVSYGYSYFIQS